MITLADALDPFGIFHDDQAAPAPQVPDVPLRSQDRQFDAGGGNFGPSPAPAATAPGGGNAFFAGLEELFSSPTAAAVDVLPGGDSGYIPPAAPGGGSAFVAGLEEAFQKPSQFLTDLGLPSGAALYAALALGVVGILGIAYIAHKVA